MAEKIQIHKRNIGARLESLKTWKTPEENKKDILITDIKILKQTYSYTSTDLDEEAMAKFLNQMMKDKKEIEN